MLPMPRVHEKMNLKDYFYMMYSKYILMDSFFETNQEVYRAKAAQSDLAITHPPTKRFQCEVCHERFTSRQGLNQHTGRMHAVFEDAVSCSSCGKEFKHRNALRFHIRQVHERSTRVTCQVCGKSCYNKHVALRHFRMKHDIF